MLDGSEFFECNCDSMEHTTRVVTYLDSEPYMSELYFDLHIIPDYRWYTRVWNAIKYVFGYESKYGEYEVFSIKTKDAKRMIDICQKLIDHENTVREKNGIKKVNSS